MILVSNVKVDLDDININKNIAKKLKIDEDEIISYKFYKKAIDSRDKNYVFFLCHFIVEVKDRVLSKVLKNKDVKKYQKYNFEVDKVNCDREVMVVGSGPAGLFASYVLALSGVKVVLIERGKKVEERMKDVEAFFTKGVLNVNSNMQYGEGGAGTFSDGKLTTNINDERIEFIKETFIECGASEDIYYLSKPHIGSDVLLEVLKKFRKKLIDLGVEILFDTTLIDLNINGNALKEIVLLDNKCGNKYIRKCENLILATGHSARDIFYMLNSHGVELARKPFSIGVRIEHRQEDINKSQYGEKYYKHPKLPSADYKLAIHLDNGRSLYTFCMCPGGVVVASSSEENEIVTNGMSYYKRDKENANSALLVNVNDTDLESGLFAGIEFQRKYEKLAYQIAQDYRAPCQLVKDLFEDKESKNYSFVKPSYLPGVVFTNLRKCLPDFVIDTLIKGLPLLDKKIKGFANGDALLIAPETRSSCPLRIIRDETCQSNIKGIYPCGEGSGYSSGITTSALDGIRVANSIISKIK